MDPLRGILVAIATPFTADGSVDENALRQMVDRLAGDGVHALIPCGSTGEFAALTHQERRRVVEIVIEQAAGRIPVVPQTGAMTTSEAIELSRHAERAGAAGVMVVGPYYEPLNMAETKDYYWRVAGSISIDVMIYNLPTATGINLAPEDIRQLAQSAHNIRYVKDSSADFDQAAVLLHDHSDVVSTFVGMDTAYMSSLVEGAHGAVLGSANLLGPGLVAIYDWMKAGDYAAAKSAWDSVFEMMKALMAGSAFVSGVKGALSILGHPVGDPRLPIQPLDEARARQFKSLLGGLDDRMLTGR
jgi:4-hydroxy-tetrahydrodipicolinate synthase